MEKLPKIVVVLGPTASGKTSLGAKICRQFNGEIISADSRQVYRGLDLGSGKERLDIPQHLIDIVDPGERFTVVDWKRQAESVIDELLAKGKLPVVVGGSSLYVTALIENYQFAPEDESLKLRSELEQKSAGELYEQLQQLAPDRASKIDQQNKRYLIRAIERALLGDTPEPTRGQKKYDALLIGVDLSRDELYANIDRRVDERMRQGMLEEVKGLLDQGVAADWLERLGLEYKFLTQHLQGELTLDEALVQLKYATHHFARRQLIWWRRRADIKWVGDQSEASALAKQFLVLSN